jgi:hypothetical protein
MALRRTGAEWALRKIAFTATAFPFLYSPLAAQSPSKPSITHCKHVASSILKFSATHRALRWKFLLKVLQIYATDQAEVNLAFGAMAVAAADGFAEYSERLPESRKKHPC